MTDKSTNISIRNKRRTRGMVGKLKMWYLMDGKFDFRLKKIEQEEENGATGEQNLLQSNSQMFMWVRRMY